MDCDIKQKVCLKKNKSQLKELALECGLTEDEIDGKTIPQLCKLIIQARGDDWEEYGCDVSSNDCNKNMSRKEIDALAKKCGIEDPKDYDNKQLLCDAIAKANKKRKKSESSDDEEEKPKPKAAKKPAKKDDDEEEDKPAKKPVKKTEKKEEEEFDPKTVSYSTLPKEANITLPKLKSIIDAQKFKISKSQNKPLLYSAIKKALKKKEAEVGEESEEEDEKPKPKKKKVEEDDDEDEKPKPKKKKVEEDDDEDEKPKPKKKEEKEKPFTPPIRPVSPPPKKPVTFAVPKMAMSVEDILKRGLRSLGLYSQIFEKYKIKNDDGKYVIEFKQIRQALKEKIGNKLPSGTMLTSYRKLIQDELDIMEEEEEEGVAEVINTEDEEKQKEVEEERIKQQKEAEEERIRQQKEGDEARIRQQKEEEEARIRQQKEEEEARIRQQKEAEKARIRQQKEAEEERIRQQKEEEEARIRQQKEEEEARIRQQKEEEEEQKEEKMDEKQRIKVMLQKIGLEKFYPTFIDEGYDRLSILLKITEEELKDYIGLNDDEIYAFMTEIAKIKKQGKGRLDKFKIYKGIGDPYMWPPKDWTEDEILEEIQKVPGEFCDPENNINCPDDEVCNLSEDPPKCVSPRFAGKIKEFKKLEEMEFKGKRIIGSESTIRILKQKLNIKEEGTPIVEPVNKSKSFKEDEEIIEEDEEVPPIPLEKNIEPKNIPEILKEVEVTKDEDLNNIKLEEAQTVILKCLGLSS